jgi:hypothetical protein
MILTGETEVLGKQVRQCTYWWNDTDRGKLKYWENKSGNVRIGGMILTGEI